jgi:pimeloyl-ACP methyl ester carboxylesterase
MMTEAVSHVEDVHRAIATRAFSLTDPASAPVRLMHEAIISGIYSAIRRTGLIAGMAATELFGAAGGSALPAGSTARGNLALAVLNATLGDELADQRSPLAIPMTVRQARSNVALERDALEGVFSRATPKMAIFLHGLGETEESWRLHADCQGRDGESTYGSRLAEDLGYTPVYLRYNTGLHISENGRRLAALLGDLVSAWPATVTELLLVGHSMGGLVARSACHQAWVSGDSWVSAVRHVFYLGTPHLGAGLEQWISELSAVLGRLEVARPLASVLERRSAGIKDLRAGYLLDDDWRVRGDRENHQTGDVPLLPWAHHYAISATVAESRHNPLGRFVGDLLVHPASAQGRDRNGRHIPFPDEHRRHFEGLHHFRLLNDPSVYETMRKWLDPASSSQPEARSVLTDA